MLSAGFFFGGSYNISDNDSKDFIDEKLVITKSGETSLIYSSKDENFKWTHDNRIENLGSGDIIIEPSSRIKPSTNTHQTDASISSYPLLINNLVSSATTISFPGDFFISEGVYFSTNTGQTWTGKDTLNSQPVNNHSGSPSVVIDKLGNTLISHLTGIINQSVSISRSPNFGSTWGNYSTVSNTNNNSTNNTVTDENPLSPNYGVTYTFWTDFSNPNLRVIKFSSSGNGGLNWSSAVQINSPSSPYPASQGVSSVVGLDGTVYAVWRDHAIASPFVGKRVGFAKSTNAGSNWSVTEDAFTMNGIRTSNFEPFNIRVNDFPKLSIDRSGGPRTNWLYVVTPQVNQSPAGTDADIILNRSSDGGQTWSEGIRVNQDQLNNGKQQFMPVVRVDEFGFINVVYFDNRNTAPDSAEVYLSRSGDGGDTWEDILLSDHRFKPSPIPGLAGNYAGDHIGITSAALKIYPVWMDNSTGNYQLWTAPFSVLNFPLNSFALTSPQPDTLFVSDFESSDSIIFAWDTSATGISYSINIKDTTTNQTVFEALSNTNQFVITLSQLENILININIPPGDTLNAIWNVTALRQTPVGIDSLESSNGPRRINFVRGVPRLSPFSLINPVNDTSIYTNILADNFIKFEWASPGNGTKNYLALGIPDLNNMVLMVPAGPLGFDTTFTIDLSDLDIILHQAGVGIDDTIQGQWTAFASNGFDSIQASEIRNIKFSRARPEPIYIDDFSNGLSNWNIQNLGGTCNWQLASEPYQSDYQMRITSNSPVLVTDPSLCGTPSTVSSMISSDGNINCSNFQAVFIQWDQDLFNLSALDTARADISYNGGISWQTIATWSDTSIRNSKIEIEILDAENNQNVRVRFYSKIVSEEAWWVIDNVLLKGDYITSNGNHTNITELQYELSQNFPNPFNPVTTISYSIPVQTNVKVKIFDLTGREIATLVNETKIAGQHQIEFNASHLSSGVYFYRIETDEFIQTKKLILLK